ncbi:MAG: glycerol kinase, partial [Caulobacteraceae bacterium]|nr:glycerol kinase [Caulobacteraceae bacterium]
CFQSGLAKNTYGTGCFMLMHTGATSQSSTHGLITTRAAQPATVAQFALEGSVFIGGAVVQWLRDGLHAIDRSAAVQALAESVPDSGGVTFVPAFTGLGAPWWDADARGALFGLTRDSGMAEIAAATFDACAYQTRDLVEAMRADAPGAFGGDAELRIDGGMSQSRWFSQRLADLTGLPVFRVDYQETTALGAALFAGLGAGLFTSVEAAAAARPGGERLVGTPTGDQQQADYQRWLKAVQRVRV